MFVLLIKSDEYHFLLNDAVFYENPTNKTAAVHERKKHSYGYVFYGHQKGERPYGENKNNRWKFFVHKLKTFNFKKSWQNRLGFVTEMTSIRRGTE